MKCQPAFARAVRIRIGRSVIPAANLTRSFPSCSALHDGFPTIDEICVLLKCLKQIEPTLACFESDLAINTRSFLRWTVGDYQLRPFDIDTSRDECRWRSSPITSRQIKHDEKLLVDRRVIPDPGVGLFVTVV
jgi:hypothetical protein